MLIQTKSPFYGSALCGRMKGTHIDGGYPQYRIIDTSHSGGMFRGDGYLTCFSRCEEKVENPFSSFYFSLHTLATRKNTGFSGKGGELEPRELAVHVVDFKNI